MTDTTRDGSVVVDDQGDERDLRDAVRGPPRRPRRPQLGFRPAPTRPRGRRAGRRGHLPQHRAAVLPEGVAVGPAARGHHRRQGPALGRAPGPQPLARRLLQRHPRPARRRPADHLARHRGLGRGDPLGPRGRSDGRRAAPRHTAGNRSPPALRGALRAAVRGLCRARRTAEPPHRQRRAAHGHHRPRRGRVPARGLVVGAPRVHAPHRLGRVRALPGAPAGVHRAGHRVGPRGARPPRPLPGPHARRRRLAGAGVGEGHRRLHVAPAE